MKKISLEQEQFLLEKKRKKRIIYFFQFFIIAVFLLLWQFCSSNGFINSFLFSSPSKMLVTIHGLVIDGELYSHMMITLWEIFISFIISSFLAILVAAILWWFPNLAKVTDPYLTILNSLPKVALGPLIIIWLGAGTFSIIFMSLLISVFVSILTIYHGFLNVSNSYIIMAKSFGASKWQLFQYVIFPYNRGNILSALKVNISMNFIGVIMGELLVSKKGIGYLIMYGSQVFNLDLVISCVFLLGIVSYLLYCIIQKIK